MNRILAMVLVLGWAASATAANWLNTNNNNQWSDGGNWSGGLEPTATDAAVINLTGANRAVISLPGELAQDVLAGDNNPGELQMIGGSLTARKIIVGNGSTGTGIFDQDAGVVTLTEDMLVGLGGGNGNWDIASGTVATRKVLVGAGTGSNGTVTQSGGTVTTVEHYFTGDNGLGTLNMTGGTIHAGASDQNVVIFGLSGAAGQSATTLGGTAQVFGNDVLVGDNAQAGNLLTVGGTAKLNAGRQGAAFRIAANNNVEGNVTVRDSGEINVGQDPLNGVRSDIVVGANGLATSLNDATLLVQDNGIVRARKILIGDRMNAKGRVTLQGGMIDLTEEFFVAPPGGGKAGVMAELEVSGGVLNARNLLMTDNMGQFATATLTGGLVDLSSNFFVSNGSLGQAMLTLDGPGTLIDASNLVVDNNGDVVHRNGTVFLSSGLIIEPDRSAGFGRGTYDLQNGMVSMGGDRRSAMEEYISAGVLFSTNPMFGGFNVVFDGMRTTLSVRPIPEPATITLMSLTVLGLAALRRRHRVL